MIIRNACVFGDDKQFSKRDIYIKEEIFSDTPDGDEIDVSDLFIIPGLIDIHFHGCVGYDFSDGDHKGLREISRYQLRNGITSICPATMTLSEEMLHRIMKLATTFSCEKGSSLIGINMEGPFLSAEKKGAQNPDYLCMPNIDMFRRLQKEANGLIRLLAIAPELDGALDMISMLKNEVRCSIAHTTANYDTALKAIRAGACHVTHLYNAMPPFHHRDPGVVGAAADMPDCFVELITDGIHIHPSMVRSTFKIFGEDRIVLISDSMMATGMDDGTYTLGGLPVMVKGNLATLEDGTIAGSATNLMDCMRTAVQKMNIPLEMAIATATINPAKAIGEEKMYGSIAIGKYADAILMTPDLNIRGIVHKGKLLNWAGRK